MEKSKKLALVGTTVLAALMLAACSTSKSASSSGNLTANAKDVAKTGFPIVKNKLQLSMFAPASVSVNYSKMAMLNDYASMTNVSFKYTTPPAADLTTKLNLALASGDVPGVIFGSNITNSTAIQYGGSTLIPLEKYIDEGYMPNLKTLLDKYPNIRKSLTTPDGHIYTLPQLASQYDYKEPAFSKQAALYQESVWFNGEWLKKLNLQVPKTTDDLVKVLTAFKNDDPNGDGKKDEIPLSSTTDGYPGLRYYLMNPFGVLSQEQQVDSKGKVTYGAITDGYRQYLEFAHKLYADGLLDNQIFSQSSDAQKAKGQADRLGAYTDWFSYFTSGKTTTEAVNDPMALPLSNGSGKAIITASDGVTMGALALTTKCSNPAAALRWADYFYSVKGAQYLTIGPDQSKGGIWHWETNNKGKKVKVFNKGITTGNSEDKRSQVTPAYGTVIPAINASSPIILANKNVSTVPDASFKEFLNQTMDKVGPHEVIGWPTLYMSEAEQNELGSTLETDLLTYVTQSEAKFITGQTPLNDSTWAAYVKTLKGIGVDKYVKVQQEAYNNWKKVK